MPRGNPEKLQPVRTKQEASERGRKGGIKSGEVRRERKQLKDELLLLLSNGDVQAKMCIAMIEQASIGNTKAFEVIRDTVGEKPVEKVEVSKNVTDIANEIKKYAKSKRNT